MGLIFLLRTLSAITHAASISGNANTTISVPTLAHPASERYANTNPTLIVPTSLISPLGLNSINAHTSVITPNNDAIKTVSESTKDLSSVISGNAGTTTTQISATTIQKPILVTHVDNPYTPSNQLIALINSKNHTIIVQTHMSPSSSRPNNVTGSSVS